jgi:putative MATE family efflux protein
MSGDAAIAEYGQSFTRLMMASLPSIMMLFLFNSIFRGAGNAVLAMRALWIGNAVNLVLDPLFIFGLGPIPAFGVTGAAMATTTGRTVGALYGLWHLTAGSGEIHLRPHHWSLDLPLMKQFIRMAVPATVQNLVQNVSWLAIVRIVAMFGSAAVAGYTIAIRILIFSILPAWGLSMAAATLVGQNLGAKQPDRAEQSVMKCGTYNMTFLAIVGAIFLAFAELIVRLFTQEPEAGSVAASALRIFALGYVFFAWGMVLVQAFNGAGDTRTPTWINFGAFWICQIPLAWFLAKMSNLGPSGAFIAVPVAYLVFVVAAYVMFRRGDWKTIKV